MAEIDAGEGSERGGVAAAGPVWAAGRPMSGVGLDDTWHLARCGRGALRPALYRLFAAGFALSFGVVIVGAHRLKIRQVIGSAGADGDNVIDLGGVHGAPRPSDDAPVIVTLQCLGALHPPRPCAASLR